MSNSVVEVKGTDRTEPVLWISVVMPTGMGKSPLCKFLRKIVTTARANRGLDNTWILDDQMFEKMGN